MSEMTPTGRELQILKVLWERSEATVRDLWKVLSETDAELAYTTVLSLMQIMESKGLIQHRSEGKAYVYSAVVRKDNTLRTLATGFLQRVFDGAVDEYLVHALSGRKPSDEELDRLEQMIVAARTKRPGKNRKAGGKL